MEGVQLSVRARGGAQRCPYCRDQLSGKVRSCDACEVMLHMECWDELDVCPAVGCAGRPKRMKAPRARPRAARLASVDDSNLVWRRLCAYGCVVRSALVHLLGVLIGLGLLAAGPAVVTSKAEDSVVGGIVLLVMGFASLIVAISWLVQVPAALRAVSAAGDAAFRRYQQDATLFVEVREDSKNNKSYHARLIPDEGGVFRFELGGILSPGWLLGLQDEPVRLWNFTGNEREPFVIERLSDGALAPTSIP